MTTRFKFDNSTRHNRKQQKVPSAIPRRAALTLLANMPLVTNLNSDDEGLLELVDGQEIVRNRSQTKLDGLDVDTESDDEGDLSTPLPTAPSNGGMPGRRRLSNGAKKRLSLGSVATHCSMPEEYDHVGLDEMDSSPQSSFDEKPRNNNRNRHSDGGSKSSRDVSVASFGTTPTPSSYHAGKGPFINNGRETRPMKDASVESGLLLSPYHAGQGPFIKLGGSSSKKKERSSRSEKNLCPPTDVMVKKCDAAKERESKRTSSKKSSRSRKSSRERSRRSRPKTACIATQTDVSGADIEGMQSKILSQKEELTAITDGQKLRDNGVEEAAQTQNLDLTKEEEDRTSALEQEVILLKLQVAQAQADLQEMQLQVHRIGKERDEALSAKEAAEEVGNDLQRMIDEMQNDSRKVRLKNQIQGTSSRNILQNQSSSMSQSAGSSRRGSKSGWNSSITSTGIFGSGSNNRRGSQSSMVSIGNLSGLFDVQDLSDTDVAESADTHTRAGYEQKSPLKRDMAQQALIHGGSKTADTFEGGSSSEQEVNDDDPFATVYNKKSVDEESVDKKEGGPFGFGLIRS